MLRMLFNFVSLRARSRVSTVTQLLSDHLFYELENYLINVLVKYWV